MDRIDADIWSARDVARLLALVENEKRYYQDILTLFPVPAAVAGRDLTMLSVNREFRKQFLPHGEDDSGRRLTDILHATVIREHIVPAFERGTPVSGAEITVFSEKGVANPWMLDAMPLPDVHNDTPQEALIVLRGVVERDMGLGALLDQAGTVVWRLDPASGELSFANDAATQQYGFTNAATWIRRVHPEDERRVAWVYEAVLESGREATVEYRLQRPGMPADESPVWVADQLLPLKKAGKTALLQVVTTLQGERRWHVAESVQVREMSAAMRLARQVAHEFNNLWMIVSGYAEVVDGLPDVDAEARASLVEISRAAHRGIETTRQLLEFARPAVGASQTFDLHTLLREWNLDADLALPPGTAPVSAAPERLKTALENLIGFSAARSNGKGRLSIETRRETLLSDFAGPSAKGQFVVVRLGPVPHVNASMADHWCEPYFSDGEKVAPIGLAPTYSQLRQMGIFVRLLAGPGQTGFFLLHLPLARLPAPPKPPVEPVEPRPQREVRRTPPPAPTAETVLVVDPDESVRALVARILEGHGYRVLIAGSGDEAVSLVLGASADGVAPEILVTDVTINGMNGPELARRLRETIPSLRVLFVSAFVDEPEFNAEELPPGEGFLQKPFTITSLTAMVRTVLDVPRS